MGTVALLPTSRFPKLMLDGLAPRLPCVPVPLNAINIMGFVALLVIVMAPEAPPVDAGANLAINDVLWPAFSVVALRSLLKPVPDALAWKIVMLLVPEFVRVMDCLLLLPTATLPKAILPGLAFSVAFAAVPAPARLRVCGESATLSVKVMLPVIPFADGGVNCTLNDTL